MDATTQAGVQSSGLDFEPGSEAAFQSLVDQGLLNDVAPQYRQPGEEEPWSAQQQEEKRAPEAKEPKEEPKKGPEQEAQPEPKDEPQQASEAEEKQYTSLDEYLKEAKLEAESFMQLPVTVKVDGQERAVPLAELQKSYQLSSAAYNRMNELATERNAFQAEQAQQKAAIEQQKQGAEALLKFAEQQILQEFQAINWQQLEAENPGQAALLWQRYQARHGAIQQHLTQLQAQRQQDAQKAEQARLQALPQELNKLLAAIPEYRDQTKLASAQQAMRETAVKVGFTPAELNGITDHRYVRILDMAARWAALQAKAPATVNRVRTAPQMAKPGARQVRDPNQVARQQLNERWEKSGFRDDEAGAAVFEQFV